jgi:hypothetical protein
VERPQAAPIALGPIKIELNDKLDITCGQGGSIQGHVGHVTTGYEGHLWIVAFDEGVMLTETRAAIDGSFRIDNLRSGSYGLKVGYDGYWDSEVPKRHSIWEPFPDSVWKTKATPWKRAVRVTVKAGEMTPVDLEAPP